MNQLSKANKVLVFDVETAPILAYVWGLFDQNIAVNQIKEDWHVLAWSAKWLGDPPEKTMYRDKRHQKPGDDSVILKPLWRLLDEADIVVTQNGKSFDSKKLNARFMLMGMKPPRPYTHLDTLRIVKQVAAFTSNKLEYLTARLCTKYRKLTHKQFPGFSLWVECLAGNKDAWEVMKKYNIHDVLGTEELYLKIRAWAPASMPKVYDVTEKSLHCGTCGFLGKMREGKPKIMKSHLARQHQCTNCGAWQKSSTPLRGKV